MSTPIINFDNSYARELEGFYVPFNGEKAPSPSLVKFNQALAKELGLMLENVDTELLARIFSGSEVPPGASPLAQVYAGHQFGGFSPQLGDGRALLLGEVLDRNGNRRDIHLKGSGRTPFSRGGDGKAVLGPVLREYIMGEAMHALNVPTTRALAAVMTGEHVMREDLLPGAVLTRVASSHIRIGTFEYFAARRETDKVRQLADYTIRRHYPQLQTQENPYLGLLREVCDRQAALVAKWMQLGFIHGVMNTDNMTLSGETIDYGPCAFMEQYDPATVFSSIDRQGRYAYGNQPPIAQWNLARLAEAIIVLIDSDTDTAVALATDELNTFVERYQQYWLEGMRTKLGLTNAEADDLNLANDLFKTLEGQPVDFTQFFRKLALVIQGDELSVRSLFMQVDKFDMWLKRWHERISRNPLSMDERVRLMNSVNPIYIPRNHKVEEVIQAAENDQNFTLFQQLLDVLASPFEERTEFADYAQPAPDEFPPYKTFCGT